MDQQLEALTRKLYDEGIQKAETEARAILDAARQEAKHIRDLADREALDIREKARREAADLTQRAQAELRLASQQTLSTLRHALESFLQQKALSEPVRAALQQPEAITGLIRLVVDRMALSDAGDPTILLSPEEEAQVRDQLNASLQDVLRQQPLIQPYPGIRAGFRIQEHSGQYQLSFTDEDFIAFLMPYLSQEIQQIIRPDHEAG
ncbi:MAG: hypothetical protein R2787_06665 [Saprospiraceae bacterium]